MRKAIKRQGVTSHEPSAHLSTPGSLRIGTVDFVSPDEIKVALDIEAPESVALNAGGPAAISKSE